MKLQVRPRCHTGVMPNPALHRMAAPRSCRAIWKALEGAAIGELNRWVHSVPFMRATYLIIIACSTMLLFPSCSKHPVRAGELPFDPPRGWEHNDKMKLFTVYQNVAEPKQSFRYFRLHINGPERLTQQVVVQKLQAMGMKTTSLEELPNGGYYAEELGTSDGPEGSLFRRNYYSVQKESSTVAIVHCVVFFCSPSAAENTKDTQEYIRKRLRNASLSQ